MREDFEAALNKRRRVRDARVVARITADPGLYQDYIRCGLPDAAEWKAAREAAAQDVADTADEHDLLAALRGVLGELRPGIPITVVEVSADGISMARADLDRFGSPRISATGATTTWTSMLPMLSAIPEERQFQLAGGMSEPDRELAGDALDRHLPWMPDGPLRVVCRVAGWEIPERAAAKAVTGPDAGLLRAAGAADATPVLALLTDLADTTPLRHAYQLMVAVVTPGSGTVGIQPRQLFAPGAPAGTQASLSLRRMPGADPAVTLAIFTDDGDAPAAIPLRLYQAEPPTGAFSLRAVLRGPGRVEILEPGDVTEYPGSWDELRAEMPSRVSTGLGPVDLVCALDLSGTADAVRRRVKLIRELIKLLREQYGDSPWLRVGVVTCTEHVFERGTRGDPVAEHLVLSSPAEAAAWLRGKQDTTRAGGYHGLAPIEDLLHESFELLRGSRDRSRSALLVTVAGRPPHPWPQPRDNRMPCPNGYMWADEIGKLTRRAAARCVMVADDPAAGHDGATGWQQLGPGGLRKLADTNSQRLAEDLGLIAGQGQRLSLPLPDDLRGGIQ
jgi:hypothetical protein